MIKGVIFDLDGVLVDAVEWHYLALNRALSVFGYQITREEHNGLYNGLPTAVKLDLLSQRSGFPKSLHRFVNELKQLYTRQVIETSCTPNIELSGLLRHLKDQGFKVAVASNSIRSTVNLVLEKMAIREYFDLVLSNEDVAKAKPNSEIYERCLNVLGLTANEVLIVEDSVPGVQAARGVTSQVLVVAAPHEVTHQRVMGEVARLGQRASISVSPVEQLRNNQTKPVVEIVIPMAGLGNRFAAAGYANPKPLIDLFGKPMVQWVVENIRPKNRDSHFTFICNEKHVRNFWLKSFLKEIAPDCSIVSLPGVTEGAACTILTAAGEVDPSRPLLIANSDQWVQQDIDLFLDQADAEARDGLIMTFRANEKKWSFAQVDAAGKVVRVAEKDPISNHATVGIYFYREGKQFFDGAKDMIRKNIRTNGEFYVCPVFNEIVEHGGNVGIAEIDRSAMHGLGTPEDLDVFKKWWTSQVDKNGRLFALPVKQVA